MVRLFQISQNYRFFHLLRPPSVLGGNFTMRPPFLHPPKAFVSSSVWPTIEYTWTLNWKESLLSFLENCSTVPYFLRRNMNRMMNTFIKVNITPSCKRQLRGYIYAYPLWIGLPSPLSVTRNRIYLGIQLKEGLIDLFWMLPGYSLFPPRESRQRMVKTLLIVNINPICRR